MSFYKGCPSYDGYVSSGRPAKWTTECYQCIKPCRLLLNLKLLIAHPPAAINENLHHSESNCEASIVRGYEDMTV